MEKTTVVRKKLKGFTLMESVVFLLLFALISTIFFETYITGTRLILESKNRLGASALANQKMEIIRSIDYTTIGTKHWNGSAWVYGIPAGDILEDEDISVNTKRYHVHTFVQYVDDAFDGQTGSSPTDTIPTDYKRVRITVSWGEGGPDQELSIFGTFAPNGVETSAGGGVLSVNVLNAAGSGVSGADVHIVNTTSGIDVTATTDSTGNVTLPGAPAGTQRYVISVSKEGYYGATTFPAYPTTPYNPVDVHASVVANTLNQKSIVMDQEVDLEIQTEDPFGNDIPSIAFSLVGGRILGTTPSTGASVLGFNQTATTNTSGVANFDNQSYGQYTFTLSGSVSGYEFFKMTPEATNQAVFDAAPGSAGDYKALLLDKNIGSLKITVTNQLTGAPVQGAAVQLTNSALSYDVTVTTDQYGYAYFPEELPALVPGTYDIDVTATGFSAEDETVTIGTTLEKKTIPLTAN